jgi:hypothetical protein
MTQVTLAYQCDGGQQAPANFASKVSGITLDEGEIPALWYGVVSDNTTYGAASNVVTRTLVLGVLPSCPFDTDDQHKDFLRGIYADKLALRVPARVTAAEPVVT